MKRMLSAVLSCLLIFLAIACSQPPPGRGAGEVENSPQSQTSFKVETVVGNLEVPWSIVWAPDGRMIFTERPGRVRVFQNGKLQSQPLFTVSDVESRSEAGLMSVALHPQFASNRWIYLSYAYSADGLQVRVVRYRETPSGFSDRKVIIENIPAAGGGAGSRRLPFTFRA
jgi:glucose/arabinose dehydrogenase